MLAKQLGISPTAVRHLIEDGTLRGEQVVPCSPWLILADSLAETRVATAVEAIQTGKRRPRTQTEDQQILDFTGLL
jgi:hypothetical protein